MCGHCIPLRMQLKITLWGYRRCYLTNQIWIVTDTTSTCTTARLHSHEWSCSSHLFSRWKIPSDRRCWLEISFNQYKSAVGISTEADASPSLFTDWSRSDSIYRFLEFHVQYSTPVQYSLKVNHCGAIPNPCFLLVVVVVVLVQEQVFVLSYVRDMS